MKAIIVEDEPLAMEELSYIIGKYSHIEVVATFDDGLDAFRYLQHAEVDVLFLDINVPSIDGMLLAHNIHQFARKPFIIFTTAYKDFAAEAFEIEAFDYILKPYSEKRIETVLNRLETTAAPAVPALQAVPPAPETAHRINLSRDGHIHVLEAEAIDYIEAAEKQCRVVTAQGDFIQPMTIGEFIEKLPPDLFFRTHRSFCINLSRIEKITPWYNYTYMLTLSGHDERIPVSRNKAKEFRQLMNI